MAEQAKSVCGGTDSLLETQHLRDSRGRRGGRGRGRKRHSLPEEVGGDNSIYKRARVNNKTIFKDIIKSLRASSPSPSSSNTSRKGLRSSSRSKSHESLPTRKTKFVVTQNTSDEPSSSTAGVELINNSNSKNKSSQRSTAKNCKTQPPSVVDNPIPEPASTKHNSHRKHCKKTSEPSTSVNYHSSEPSGSGKSKKKKVKANSAEESLSKAEEPTTKKYPLRNRRKQSEAQPLKNKSTETLGGSQWSGRPEVSSGVAAASIRRSARITTTGSCTSTSRRSSRGGVKLALECGAMSGRDDSTPTPTPTPASVSASDHDTAHPAAGMVGSGPSSATTAAATGGGGAERDSESDDSEVGRLQALLEARGLPPHLLGALGPRMQHLLHRSMGANCSSKAQQLLQGLQSVGDEGQQLQAVIEMCQMLVMGNEDTLAGFPVKQVVPALINLLAMDHNFDMMNHACRALTYMMEALPRSSAVVLDAVPTFLEKLQVIQCMDVAEQSLTALEMLSRRHSKSILQARGVSACLTYLDFFSINAQRAALAITANCCQNLHSDEFVLVSQSLSLLATRLTQQDKKSVESVCLAFSRLVDSYQNDTTKLQEIASTQLLTNLQQLLVVTPPVISTGTFITVLRMLSVMCANCPDLAVILLKQNFADTLCYLLTGLTGEAIEDEVELVSRSPQELYEMTCLIAELMPRLPRDGIFTVDSLLERVIPVALADTVAWQWRDDRGLWHPYTPVDSRILEAAHQSGEDEISLLTLGRTYTVDFHSMQQINEDTGTSRPVQRRVIPPNTPSSPTNPPSNNAVAENNTNNNRSTPVLNNYREGEGLSDVAASFIRTLFNVLYEVYSSSAGPAVRCKCLRALLRMVYYASPELLQEVLKAQIVSSHLAGMLASQELRIVVGALQMAEILIQKLPDVFNVHFTREGVMHQIKQLADPGIPLSASPPKSAPPPPVTLGVNCGAGPSTSNGAVSNLSSTTLLGPDLKRISHQDLLLNNDDTRSNVPLRFSDVLKRRQRYPKKTTTSSRKTRQDHTDNLSATVMQDFFSKAANLGSGSRGNSGSRSRLYGSSSSKTSSFLASLNPARWGRNDRHINKDASALSKCTSNANLSAGNREKARQWVRDRASHFVEAYQSRQDVPVTVLVRLTTAIAKLDTQIQNGQGNDAETLSALTQLREIVMASDISPFEVNHSGLIHSFLNFLTHTDDNKRDDRLRAFLHVFANCPLDGGSVTCDINITCLSALVTKLSGCVSQLEQFPVKVHDLPAGTGSTTALKFFNTHQLKCHLQRHPECNSLKQWKGGTVKIDPLALVQAIERYLVVRGYARLRDKDSGDSDDDNSEEDIDDTLAAVVISQGAAKHKLQFVIGDHVLPYNMTVYQAIRQFSPAAGNDQSETDTDSEAPLGSANIWVQTHTVYYRPVPEEESVAVKVGASLVSPRKGKSSNKVIPFRRKQDELWTEGNVPAIKSPLDVFLTSKLPVTVSVQDSSLSVLCLLRVLHALNRYWGTLYTALDAKPLLSQQEFVNNKIAAKASRQLQDPLVIMTGNLPSWLQQIASVCPFLLPFETRQLLLYATSFDRDRALQRLLDSSPELAAATDSQERVTPRLDRRKRTVSRDDILKQAEAVIQDLAASKALLEVQYENEVGTGLGPTLEFYALVSRELQRTDLDLWEGPKTGAHIFAPTGLFPAPLGRATKVSQTVRIRSKFRFLGKFMAKAVMDSRMLDLPLSVTFYRWLLGEESTLSLPDLAHVVPDIHRTLLKFQAVIRQKQEIEADTSLTSEERNTKISALTLDGCCIEDLGLDFVLPGHANVDLRKGGKDIPVTIHNLEEYSKLVCHWYLIEGVSRQMESFREGFESVFPLSQLSLFYPEELDAVFCGHPTGWDVKTLIECCRLDHGYTSESKAVKYLFQVLSNYTSQEQRDFVQFVTGSPRLPVGGFKSLSPPLTVVYKTLEPNMNPDDFLPSVMTCVNYLKLPDYSTEQVMRSKLSQAAKEGQHCFHLS
uniref:E3 ubiquitin-protein ligase n=1 Tax=Clastoptera arizonana TaxID=38151 RepID=A0A1B6CDK3_9HEMI